jgi:hypothetical protein
MRAVPLDFAYALKLTIILPKRIDLNCKESLDECVPSCFPGADGAWKTEKDRKGAV